MVQPCICQAKCNSTHSGLVGKIGILQQAGSRLALAELLAMLFSFCSVRALLRQPSITGASSCMRNTTGRHIEEITEASRARSLAAATARDGSIAGARCGNVCIVTGGCRRCTLSCRRRRPRHAHGHAVRVAWRHHRWAGVRLRVMTLLHRQHGGSVYACGPGIARLSGSARRDRGWKGEHPALASSSCGRHLAKSNEPCPYVGALAVSANHAVAPILVQATELP